MLFIVIYTIFTQLIVFIGLVWHDTVLNTEIHMYIFTLYANILVLVGFNLLVEIGLFLFTMHFYSANINKQSSQRTEQ